MPAEWYDFIPLPEEKKPAPDVEALTHARQVPGRYSGYVDLVLVTKSPVHIGSGAYELSEDAGLEEGTVVKGMARVADEPVIPSSSLKGALRSVYETITHSCVSRFRAAGRESYSDDPKKSELPRALAKTLLMLRPQSRNPIAVRLKTEDIGGVMQCRLDKGKRNLGTLCPACALFGIENFQGRLSFDDARILELPKVSKEAVSLPSLHRPRVHRLGEPTVIKGKTEPFILVRNLKGRKAYYNVHLGDVPAEGQILVDYLPATTRLKTWLNFSNLTLAELGGLLTALGLDLEHSFPFRVGGGKPVGLGCITFELQGIHTLNSEATFIEFDPSATKEVTREACLKAFRQSQRTLFYRQGLEKLCEIAARSYVSDEESNT